MKARKILSSSEADIRGLITDAAKSQDYQAVSELAELAQTLSSLAETNRFLRASALPSKPGSEGQVKSAQSPKRSSPKKTGGKKRNSPGSSRSAKDYPKYHIDRDRLVKIGWSKKHRDTYEHRASRDAVEAVVQRLNEKATPDRAVAVDELGAVELANGNEVPVYQIYMTIAWLLVINQLSKEGRDGYRFDNSVDSIDLSKIWGSTLIGES